MFFSLPKLSLLGMLVASSLVLAAPVPNDATLDLYSRGATPAQPCVDAKGNKGKRGICQSSGNIADAGVPSVSEFKTYMTSRLPANTALFYSLPPSAHSYQTPVEQFAKSHGLNSVWTLVDPRSSPTTLESNEVLKVYWTAASTAMAQLAKGTVYVLMGPAGSTIRPDSMWNTVEWPILEKKLKKKEITVIMLRQGKVYRDIAREGEVYVHK